MIAGAPVGNLLGSTDHQPHEVLAIEACHAAALAGVAAVAKDRDGVADRLDLFELVADEQHADAVVAQLAQKTEQRIRLMRRQRGRGLVEQQHLGAERQRLGDLDKLHLGDAEA